MAIQCKQHNVTEDPYVQCITYDTEVDFSADIHAANSSNLLLTIDSISIAIKGVIDSARGPNVGYFFINLGLAAAMGTIKVIINNFLKNGFDLNPIIVKILGTDLI